VTTPVILRERAESLYAVFQFVVAVVVGRHCEGALSPVAIQELGCLSFCGNAQNPSMLFSDLSLVVVVVVVFLKTKKPHTYI
jgi:hypothetical protein